MSVFTNKYFWVEVITVAIAGITFAANNNLFSSCIQYLLLVNAMLTAALGILDAQKVKKLKTKIVELEKKVMALSGK
jgi:hypothetical protein